MKHFLLCLIKKKKSLKNVKEDCKEQGFFYYFSVISM